MMCKAEETMIHNILRTTEFINHIKINLTELLKRLLMDYLFKENEVNKMEASSHYNKMML